MGVRSRVDDGKGADDRAKIGEVGALKRGVVVEYYGDRVGARRSLKTELGDRLGIGY